MFLINGETFSHYYVTTTVAFVTVSEILQQKYSGFQG